MFFNIDKFIHIVITRTGKLRNNLIFCIYAD